MVTSKLLELLLRCSGAARKNEFTQDRIANFSSYIRENQGQLFSENDLDFALRIRTPSVPEKATKLLSFIAKEHPYGGQLIDIPSVAVQGQMDMVDNHKNESFDEDTAMIEQCRLIFPYIAASWSRNAEEFLFLLQGYLDKAMRFVWVAKGPHFYSVTSEGWKYLQALEADGEESSSAFVAMWFDQETDSLWKQGIRPGVFDAGYEPLRIDQIEHSNKIDDEIIARIRASKFVVADFTGQRGGVYFEAGFALGLGRRVIWCVREADLKQVHFDNRQFNFLQWKPNQIEDFRGALKFRIEAMFGKGPIKLSEK